MYRMNENESKNLQSIISIIIDNRIEIPININCFPYFVPRLNIEIVVSSLYKEAYIFVHPKIIKNRYNIIQTMSIDPNIF